MIKYDTEVFLSDKLPDNDAGIQRVLVDQGQGLIALTFEGGEQSWTELVPTYAVEQALRNHPEGTRRHRLLHRFRAAPSGRMRHRGIEEILIFEDATEGSTRLKISAHSGALYFTLHSPESVRWIC